MENIIMDKKLYSACPDGVNEKQKEVFAALDALGISYEVALHESIGTIEGLLEVCDLLGASIHKNLFLCNAQKTDFYLLVMPGEKPFKTKLLSPQLGCSRLSFAPVENMEELLRCTPGSASVLGLIFDKGLKVRLVIDKDILGYEYFGQDRGHLR